MATVAITADLQRANAEILVGKDPGKGNTMASQADRYSKTHYRNKLRDIKQLEKDVPVTILNMNPFPLKINGGVLFPEEVPACAVGKPYAIYVIREIRWQSKDNGCDAQNMMQMEPIPYVPLTLAAEYIREFMQQDGSFGGVLCYVGDKDPTSIGKNEIVSVPEISYDRDEFFVDLQKRNFHEMFARVKSKRNGSVLRALQSANSWYENDHQRNFVNDTHRDLARLALAEGLIDELPRWVMQANVAQERVEPCPACQAIPKAGALICVNCRDYVFDVVAAYKHSVISYGHVSMDRLDAKGWAEVEAIRAERERARGVKKQ